MAKIGVTIDFTENTLTLIKGSGMASSEQHLFFIKDPLGDTVYINDGYNSSTFTSPDLDGSNSLLTLEVNLPTDSSGNIVQGVYTMKSRHSTGGKFSETEFKATYCVTKPSVDLDITYNCLTSTLVSTDVTDYGLSCTCTGSKVPVSNTVREHTVKYPNTMEVPIADVTSTSAVVTITPIWTKRFVSNIENFLRYTMPSATYVGDMEYYIEGTITGIAYKDVLCDDCICSMYACMKKMFTTYMNEVGRNDELSSRYLTILSRLSYLYTLYSIAQNCGNETELRSICGQITAIINLSGCTCCQDDDSEDYSVEVIAVLGSSVSISGTKWYSGSGIPSSSEGNVGDFYLDITGYGVYKKTNGGWVLQFTMTLTGKFGNYVFDHEYTIADVINNIYTAIGKEYTIDANDFKLDGCCFKLTSNFYVSEPTAVGTAIRVDLIGDDETTQTEIIIDGGIGGSPSNGKFPLTIEIEYYISKIDNVSTVVGVLVKAMSEGGLVYYNYKTAGIALASTGNLIKMYAKTNNVQKIRLNTTKLIVERTLNN